MNIFNENLHERLKQVFYSFDEYCKSHGIKYFIVADESNAQGYLIHRDCSSQADGLTEYLDAIVSQHDIYMQTDSRKDGVLYSFGLGSIQDDFWQVTGAPYAMPGQPKKKKRSDYSPLSRPADVKKVRAGKMPIQKLGNVKAKKASFGEDQYKNPTGRHRRAQSMFPSSFDKSRSFGGVKNDRPRRKKKVKESVGPINLRPLGLFGPGDKSKPQSSSRAGPPPGTNVASNVQAYGEKKPKRAGFGSGGKPVRRSGGGTRAESFQPCLDYSVCESYREDDIYTTVQRIALDAGMSAPARKIKGSDTSYYAKACDGTIKIEASNVDSVIFVEISEDGKTIHKAGISPRIGNEHRNEKVISQLIDITKEAIARN